MVVVYTFKGELKVLQYFCNVRGKSFNIYNIGLYQFDDLSVIRNSNPQQNDWARKDRINFQSFYNLYIYGLSWAEMFIFWT